MNEKDISGQRLRAYILFIGFVLAFGVCLYFLMGLEFRWDPVLTLVKNEVETYKDENSLDITSSTDLEKRTDEIWKSFDTLKWVLAALVGSALYLLGEIATYYPKIGNSANEDQGDFIKQTPWYISTWLKAPILTVVTMWLLINLKINIGDPGSDAGTGIAINMSAFSEVPFVLTGIAFILGFYGRVTRKQLDILAKYLFTRAWALAEQGFYVDGPAVLLIKEEGTYTTSPSSQVLWSATPTGTINADTGVYKTDSIGDHDKTVYVRATLKTEPSITGYKEVKLKAVKINGPTEVTAESPVSLSLETKLTDKFTDKELQNTVWSSEDSNINKSVAAKKGKGIDFTAPPLGPDDKEDKKIKVTAKLAAADKTEYSADITITVKKKA